MEPDEPPKLDNLMLGEIQVLLAEKRTALVFAITNPRRLANSPS
jgi:hypothetical protein